MSHSTSHAGSQTFPVRRSPAGLIGLWVAQIALASLFLLAGGLKLAGAPAIVTLFEAIGVGQWFRYLTGLIEVGSAIALFVPSLAFFGAVALVATMLGAIATHVFVVGGSPAVPAVLLLAALVVVWARRGQRFAALRDRAGVGPEHLEGVGGLEGSDVGGSRGKKHPPPVDPS